VGKSEARFPCEKRTISPAEDAIPVRRQKENYQQFREGEGRERQKPKKTFTATMVGGEKWGEDAGDSAKGAMHVGGGDNSGPSVFRQSAAKEKKKRGGAKENVTMEQAMEGED